MVTWNVPFERELIKQSSLFDLPMPHHDSQSCLSQRLNQGTSCVATEDFFNKICQIRTFQWMAELLPPMIGSISQSIAGGWNVTDPSSVLSRRTLLAGL